MKPSTHALISTFLAAVLFLVFKSIYSSIACILAGVLIDLDHILDYIIEKKKMVFSYQKLEDFCAFDKQGKLYLIFHSYEFLIILWIAVWFSKFNVIFLGGVIGITFHIFADEIVNPLRPLSYFLIFRTIKGFKRENILKKEYLEEHYK